MQLLVKENTIRTPKGPSVSEALVWATALLRSARVDTPRLDAECLLASLLCCDRLQLYAALEKPLPSSVLEGYRALVARRQAREPLAYLTGTKEFWSLSFKVTPAVLIPRPETEILVETALRRLRGLQEPMIVDIGVGSGAIGVAIAKALPRARVHATEISGRALEVARENAGVHEVLGQISFLQGDLLDPLSARGLAGQCDLIVSNPPYVAASDLAALPPEVHYEPVEALNGGADGLRFHRRIIARAGALLRPGGWLALEMGPGQGRSLIKLFRDQGTFTDVEVARDLGSRQRVIIARHAVPGFTGHR
ncbi:MAG: peptide chain release factor N(5)-glutamine methyltransferase [candidate division NC10 bacterium]|nr:peptide chain release factor N(5)-glutamine methyltransferase [candidate division NC10 bacterium]